ncbi:MAG: hypothetical protein FIA82_12035 [Melioribacter sp.]|nr:hypothetical protein [Melioribacter sp.]
MKARFVIILSVLFLFGFTAQSFSQGMGGMNQQDRMKQQLQTYKERLKLTDAQFNKIDTILKDQMSEIQKLRDSSSGDRDAMREAMMSLREKINKKIEALLDDTQKAEFKKIQEEAAQRRQGMGRG